MSLHPTCRGRWGVLHVLAHYAKNVFFPRGMTFSPEWLPSQGLFDPKTPVIQKRHFYTRILNTETSGDSEKRVSTMWKCLGPGSHRGSHRVNSNVYVGYMQMWASLTAQVHANLLNLCHVVHLVIVHCPFFLVLKHALATYTSTYVLCLPVTSH